MCIVQLFMFMSKCFHGVASLYILKLLIFQDVYDRNITVYNMRGYEIWNQIMLNLPPPFPELAEKIYMTNSWEEYDNITIYGLLEKESIFSLVRNIIKNMLCLKSILKPF